MDHLARLLALLLSATPESWTASRYADTPADEGGTPACRRRCLREEGGTCVARFPEEAYRRMHPRRCAHRTLPCGTAVLLIGPAGASHCFVLDRGPYGRNVSGKWRGQVDLSPVPAGEVGIWSPEEGPGRVPVTAFVLGGNALGTPPAR